MQTNVQILFEINVTNIFKVTACQKFMKILFCHFVCNGVLRRQKKKEENILKYICFYYKRLWCKTFQSDIWKKTHYKAHGCILTDEKHNNGRSNLFIRLQYREMNVFSEQFIFINVTDVNLIQNTFERKTKVLISINVKCLNNQNKDILKNKVLCKCEQHLNCLLTCLHC